MGYIFQYNMFQYNMKSGLYFDIQGVLEFYCSFFALKVVNGL